MKKLLFIFAVLCIIMNMSSCKNDAEIIELKNNITY